jgi:hypothetical protein
MISRRLRKTISRTADEKTEKSGRSKETVELKERREQAILEEEREKQPRLRERVARKALRGQEA